MARRKEAGRPRADLQRSRERRSSSTTTRRSPSASGPSGAWPTRAAGARDLPPIKGHPKLAAHIGNSLMADEFDMSFFQHRALDHGVFSPLSVLCPHEPEWPVALVPLADGRAADARCRPRAASTSSARRCGARSRATRRTCEVAIVATGGLSHQVHGERAGFNNPEWDAALPRPLRERSGAARRHDHRRVRRARRLRGLGGRHVAHHARRAVRRASSASTAATTCRR